MLLDIAERSLATPSMTLSSNNNASSTGLLALSLATEEVGKKKVRSTNSSYEILSNVIWEEVATRLMAELGHIIFAAGRPSIFHQVSTLLFTNEMKFTNKQCLLFAELLSNNGIHISYRISFSKFSLSRPLTISSNLYNLHKTIPTSSLFPIEI